MLEDLPALQTKHAPLESIPITVFLQHATEPVRKFLVEPSAQTLDEELLKTLINPATCCVAILHNGVSIKDIFTFTPDNNSMPQGYDGNDGKFFTSFNSKLLDTLASTMDVPPAFFASHFDGCGRLPRWESEHYHTCQLSSERYFLRMKLDNYPLTAGVQVPGLDHNKASENAKGSTPCNSCKIVVLAPGTQWQYPFEALEPTMREYLMETATTNSVCNPFMLLKDLVDYEVRNLRGTAHAYTIDVENATFVNDIDALRGPNGALIGPAVRAVHHQGLITYNSLKRLLDHCAKKLRVHTDVFTVLLQELEEVNEDLSSLSSRVQADVQQVLAIESVREAQKSIESAESVRR